MIVLFVEDDQKLAQQTIDFLALEHIDVDYVSSISAAKQVSIAQRYDAIILDMKLPDGDGTVLAQHFQRDRPDTPIIFLTGQDNIRDKLSAFDAGALDYLTKPFELAELTIRLKLLLTKGKTRQSSSSFLLDDLSVNFAEKILSRSKRAITLSPQQWTLLALLAQQSPAYVSKQQIIATVWPDQDVSNDMYKSLLSRLRTNLTGEGENCLLFSAKKVGVALRAAMD